MHVMKNIYYSNFRNVLLELYAMSAVHSIAMFLLKLNYVCDVMTIYFRYQCYQWIMFYVL